MGVRTFTESAADLTEVLAAPEMECPCVVVGESLGGSIALVALAADAANIAGLLLLDAPYPQSWEDFAGMAPPDSPEAGLSTDPYNLGENEEQLDLIAGFSQVTAPAVPPSFPVIVVSHGAGNPPPCNWEPPCSASYPVEDYEAAWQAGQAELAESLGGQLVVAENTGHSIAGENPQLVVELLGQVVAAVRDPATSATPTS
jgi:pimeloyl-ACP methyl ester carboxylesterase